MPIAPTLTSSNEEKARFDEDLDQIIRSTQPSDKLIILGDFNACVGKDTDNWNGVLRSHSLGKLSNACFF